MMLRGSLPLQSSEVECEAPHSTGRKGPAFSVPAGACDCHMHIFDAKAPFAPGPVLTHGDATVEHYRQLQRRLRIERCVLVQPSGYGRDNRVLLRGLQSLGNSACGVAVIDPSATQSELEVLRAAGVVGVRFNLVQAGATSEQMLEDVARLIRPFGWHIQLHAHPVDLLNLADRLTALPVPVVIDHFARINAEPAMSDRVKAVLLRMMGSGNVWMKMSAPYIASPDSKAYEDLDDFVRHLAGERLDRLVWGTDWPHVTESSKPDDAVLINLLARWLSEDEIRVVLVENAARLYHFTSGGPDRPAPAGADR